MTLTLTDTPAKRRGAASAINYFEGALCKGRPVETFFPEKKVKPDTYQQFCKACPIQQFCLNFSLCFDSYGVWGGLTRRQRAKLPASMKKEAKEIGKKEGWIEILQDVEDIVQVVDDIALNALEPQPTPKKSVFSFSRSSTSPAMA